jgi:arylsulfatase A-like enzyme
VVLIVIDALRPDHLGCYGHERPTSPVIDALAANSILFETAISAAPWTKTSFSSFLTSLYPFQHGVGGWSQIMPDSIVTLPEVLGEHGYSTMAVINMLGITGRFKVLKGIDEVSAAAKYKRDATKATSDAIEIMSKAEPPFFILIHYYDVHWPYRPPAKYVDMIRIGDDIDPFAVKDAVQRSGLERPPQEMIDREILLYDACIRYTDTEIGEVLDFLDGAGLRDETVVIITSDHGEAFWEHGAGSHGWTVHDEEIKVPLIFNNRSLYPTARRIDEQVSLLDLVPTITEIAGASDSHHREGRDLGPLIRKGAFEPAPGRFLPTDLDLAESTLKKTPDTRGIRSQDWKIILEPATSLVQLYNLRDDPEEADNLWGRAGAIGDSLAAMAQQIPGSSLNGWRVGFTGAGSITASFRVEVEVEEGHKLTGVEKLVVGAGEAIRLSDDRTAFHFGIRPWQQQIVLFDTEPPRARIRFDISGSGKELGDVVYTGIRGTVPLGKAFTLDRDAAFGTPEVLDTNRRAGLPGVYVWWLPGGKATVARETTELTPEEIQRLKALGYIQ